MAKVDETSRPHKAGVNTHDVIAAHMLPNYLSGFIDGVWQMAWPNNIKLFGKFHSDGSSEANVRAQMLIYLLENNIMEIPK